MHNLLRKKGSIKSVTTSHDSAWLLTTCSIGHATIYDVETGEQVHEFRVSAKPLRSAAFSPGNAYIVTASTAGITSIWDVMAGRIVQELRGHKAAINTAVFSHAGTHVLTASDDGTCALWCLTAGGADAVTNVCEQTYRGQDHCSSAIFSRDDKRILMAADSNAKILATDLGWCLVTLQGHLGTVTSSQFSSDDVLVLTGSEDRTTILWKRTTRDHLDLRHGARGMVPARGLCCIDLGGRWGCYVPDGVQGRSIAGRPDPLIRAAS